MRDDDGSHTTYPRLRSTVLDTVDVHGLADFYRRLLGWEYAPGNGPEDDDADEWQIIRSPGSRQGLRQSASPRAAGQMLAFQYAARVPRSTWPDTEVPQQLHLDFTVATEAELEECHDRALALGATLIRDESDDPAEPICVYADPAGHPFCIFVMEW
ncbi:VOC family protein [Brevibacterium yomogidense]|uniref:VOC family protein n=1 Tax=Brevibacterium yomogidense TaxID=946573 RepID=UPI0018E05726|nr:VOC family protein [Brevibacterium yomogidense]